MTNRITVEPQPDGTETWSNEDSDTGEVLRYSFLPVSLAAEGVQIEAMQQFVRGERSAKRDEPGRVLTGPEVTALRALPAGTFFRTRELARTPPRPADAKPGVGKRR